MLEFTPTELKSFREVFFQGFSDDQFDLAIAECQRRNLIPGTHIHFELRNSKRWVPELSTSVNEKKLTRVTTIDAFRLISQRTGEYEGQGDAEYIYLDDNSQPSIISKIPLPHPDKANTPREPWAARVPIFRKGFRHPVQVVARFDAYAVLRKMGDKFVLTDMWSRRGPEQLAKCSEAAARRVAFPEELGSMYLHEEFAKEDAETTNEVPSVPVPVVEPPKVASIPTVNHTPAVATDTPRPGEVRVSPKLAEALAEVKSAAETTLVEVLVPKPVPEILSPTADPVARKARVKKATETFMEHAGKPLPKHEQTVEPSVPIGATDDDLPAEMFKEDSASVQQAAGIDGLTDNQRGGPPPNSAPAVQIMDDPPNKEEAAIITATVRSYYQHGCKPDDLKKYALRIAGKEKPSEIGKQAWALIFANLDAALAKGGKKELIDLVTF